MFSFKHCSYSIFLFAVGGVLLLPLLPLPFRALPIILCAIAFPMPYAIPSFTLLRKEGFDALTTSFLLGTRSVEDFLGILYSTQILYLYAIQLHKLTNLWVRFNYPFFIMMGPSIICSKRRWMKYCLK